MHYEENAWSELAIIIGLLTSSGGYVFIDVSQSVS